MNYKTAALLFSNFQNPKKKIVLSYVKITKLDAATEDSEKIQISAYYIFKRNKNYRLK